LAHRPTVTVYAAIALTCCATAVCAQVAPSSPAQKQQLEADIAAVDQEIKAAETETANYSGGLIKSLVDLRLTTLRQTRALLDQRRKAGSHAVALRYTVDGKTLAIPAGELASVEAEIASTKANIEKQQAEADKYSGGLVQAMALSTVATSRQTLAMLEQKRLAIKHGLPNSLDSRRL
jgi:hypothetical protein